MTEFCFETVNWSPYFGFEHPDVSGMIRAAADNGFRWISFDLPTIDYYRSRGGTHHSLRAELAAFGVKLLAVHSLAVGSDIDEVEKLAKPVVEACHALGAHYLHAGVVAPVDDKVVAATRHAGRMCEAVGVGFAVEFLPFLPVASIVQTRDLLRAAGLKGPGLVVDSWHFFYGPDDWADLETITAEEIAYIQFDDHGPLPKGIMSTSADLLTETTQNRVLPGEGSFDLKRFADTLRRAGYDGVVGPEILSAKIRTQPLGQVAKRIMETTKPYWS